MISLDGDVALILGAGGPVGHAFHAGILAALAAHGWDPRGATIIAGTSSGAQVAALLRAGLSPADLYARARGVELSAAGAAIARHLVRPPLVADPALQRRLWPSSPAYLGRALRRPWTARGGRLLTAVLPRGRVSLDPLAAGLRHLFALEWPVRALWIVAVDLMSGERVVFGRPLAPPADVGAAVASSCAVPLLCAPVEIDGREYVDGAVASPTSADLLADANVRRALVLSPLSRFAFARGELRGELRRLRGVRIACSVFEPDREVRAAMGRNPMQSARAPGVAEAAFRLARDYLSAGPTMPIPRPRGAFDVVL